MPKINLSFAAAIAVIGFASNASAIMTQQGHSPNGITIQGLNPNGTSLLGIQTTARATVSPQSLLAVESVLLPTGETVDLR